LNWFANLLCALLCLFEQQVGTESGLDRLDRRLGLGLVPESGAGVAPFDRLVLEVEGLEALEFQLGALDGLEESPLELLRVGLSVLHLNRCYR
jgi:hypothetical protein